MEKLISEEVIEQKIFLVRGHKVMLDAHLAALYGVTTFNFNKAVKRNIDRFPDDFMFQLTYEEFESLTFQFGISKKGRGGRRYCPYVFTEQGVAWRHPNRQNVEWVFIQTNFLKFFATILAFFASYIVGGGEKYGKPN